MEAFELVERRTQQLQVGKKFIFIFHRLRPILVTHFDHLTGRAQLTTTGECYQIFKFILFFNKEKLKRKRVLLKKRLKLDMQCPSVSWISVGLSARASPPLGCRPEATLMTDLDLKDAAYPHPKKPFSTPVIHGRFQHFVATQAEKNLPSKGVP